MPLLGVSTGFRQMPGRSHPGGRCFLNCCYIPITIPLRISESHYQSTRRCPQVARIPLCIIEAKPIPSSPFAILPLSHLNHCKIIYTLGTPPPTLTSPPAFNGRVPPRPPHPDTKPSSQPPVPRGHVSASVPRQGAAPPPWAPSRAPRTRVCAPARTWRLRGTSSWSGRGRG